MARLLAVLCVGSAACSPLSSPDAGADECLPQNGAGTAHAETIRQPETWTAAASPHLISSALAVQAEVTIEPCAVVRLGPDVTLTVSGGGRLVSAGRSTQPVVFERLDAARPWAQLRALSGGTLHFSHTRVIGGGAPGNAPLDVAAAIELRGSDQTKPPEETFHVDHVLVLDSASQGVSVREAGGFSTGSTALEVRGSKHAPLRTWASAAGTIPSGAYVGNTVGPSAVSFLSGNDLSGAARCKETFPTPRGSACPAPPPCP